ncbi:MAG: hypothetical protein P8Z79_18460 [Sedimentisphaerales bacterium]|jgi:hypothetical protein
MRHNVRNNGNHGKRRAGRFVGEKKRVVAAICLIAVMAFMWIRVLTQKSPEAAAGAVEPSSGQQASKAGVEMAFVELPKVAGRDDVITRDFFNADNWQHFIDRQRKRKGLEEVNVLVRDGSEEVMRRVAGKLKLEAIMVSENPRAYINGEVVEVGDKMFIGEGVDKYECDVVVIEEGSVVIRCGKAEITLKLVQESKKDD